MVRVQDVVEFLEQHAPLCHQAAYDNAGLQVGDVQQPVTGVLTCLDVTEQVLKEAQQTDCQLIVSHHPVLFKPLKKLTGCSAAERLLAYAVRHNTAIYAAHTNLDSVLDGVSGALAETLGLKEVKVLSSTSSTTKKLTMWVACTHAVAIQQALRRSGAVTTILGPGENPPLQNTMLQSQSKALCCIEAVLPLSDEKRVLAALANTHPCPSAAYTLQSVHAVNSQVGLGAIGHLPESLSIETFLQHVRQALQTRCIRHSCGDMQRSVRRIAVCGGAGSFLAGQALAQGADVLLTADLKYHDFTDASEKMLLVDVGHYESEIGAAELLRRLISNNFAKIAVATARTAENPVRYFF